MSGRENCCCLKVDLIKLNENLQLYPQVPRISRGYELGSDNVLGICYFRLKSIQRLINQAGLARD